MTEISRAPVSQRSAQSRDPFANADPQFREGDLRHTVERGETLTAIARQHNLSPRELIEANPQIRDPSRIAPGDLVRIPTMSHGEAPSELGEDLARRSSPGVAGVPDRYEGAARTEGEGQRAVGSRPAETTAQRGPAAAGSGDPTAVDDNIAGVATVAGTLSEYAGRVAPHLDDAGRAARVLRDASRAGPALAAVGGLATGIDQATEGTTNTAGGALVNGAAAGGLSVAFGSANPVLAAVDAVSSMAGGPSLSGATNQGINSVVTLGEAAVTGNTQGLEELNRRNLNGDNGQIARVAAGYGEAFANGDTRHLDNYQREALRGDHGAAARTLAESGDYWARHGIAGGLQEFGRGIAGLFD